MRNIRTSSDQTVQISSSSRYFTVPWAGIAPAPTFVEGGLRLHFPVRSVPLSPACLLTSAVVVHVVGPVHPGPARAAESSAGFVQELALPCPTICPTIASWLNDRSDRSHFPPTSPRPSTKLQTRKARRSARGSPRPPRADSGSTPGVRASPSGSARTAHSLLMSWPRDSLAPERCSAVSRRARAPE